MLRASQAYDQGRFRGPLGFSLAAHLAFVSMAFFFQAEPLLDLLDAGKSRHRLGYPGQGPASDQLDLLQANALHFRFFQPPSQTSSGTGAEPGANRSARVVRAAPERAAAGSPSADGAMPAKPREEVRSPSETSESAEVGDTSANASGGPALQPDVVFADDLTILHLVKPVYPEHELAIGIKAKLLVDIHVTTSGEIDDAKVREAVTDPPGRTQAFEITALEALVQWRVRLPRDDEYRNGYWLTVPIEYSPADKDFDRLEGGVHPERATSSTP